MGGVWRGASGAVRRVPSAGRVVACGLASVGVALACGWSGPPDSVRFSGWGDSNERDYSRLPPLSPDAARPAERASDDKDEGETYAAAERRRKLGEELWARATDPAAAADRAAASAARAQLREALAALEDQDKRNTAFDLLDAFTALDAGSPPAAVRSYMEARRLYDQTLAAPPPTQSYAYPPTPAPTPPGESGAAAGWESQAEAVRRALDEVAADRNLADNAAYLRAAVLYRGARYAEAAAEFSRLVARWPRSEKREPALLMSALSHLKLSRAYRPADESATSSGPCADCRDEAWSAAFAGFERLLREHPRGRFRADARGWLAFLHLRAGDAGAGLAEYYRLLADDADEAGRANALVSLRLARDDADDAAMRRAESLLASEPRAALAYAYHSLYNFAPAISDWYLPPPERAEREAEEGGDSDAYDPSNWRSYREAKETGRRVGGARSRELRRVAEFAAAMLRRHPRAGVGGEFALRLAEANFELDEPRPALEYSARALAAGLAGERRAEALWVKGTAEYRLRRYEDARRSLSAVFAENPAGRLAPGARRLVAMIAEDAGDLDAALEQYLALGYREDAAYLFDVLMTPEQLAAFVGRRPDDPRRDELLYALGVRYLRAGRYAEARAAYARVRTSPRQDHFWDYESACVYDADSPRCQSPKYPIEGYDGGVPERWLLFDLQTADRLEAFDRDFAEADNDEAKAEALYQKASYIYESDLLFYNPAAWRGSRFYLLADLDRSHRYRAPGEAQTLFRYAGQHDMAARALDLYLETARRFPRTRAARDSLYTAAVCHLRLAEYNDYWRERYTAGLHAGERMVTFADVRAAYPGYGFPAGTYGWQPSTRTVNGRAAWPAPPKPPPPQPRPTRAQRAKRLAVAYWASIWPPVAWLAARAWHWLTVALVFAGCLSCGRLAARARAGWRAALARREERTKTASETLRELWDALRAAAGGRAQAWEDRRRFFFDDARSGDDARRAGDDARRGDDEGRSAGDDRRSESAAPSAAAEPWLYYEPRQTRIELRAHKLFHAAEVFSRATARALWHYVRPLTHDAHGRHLLAANAAAHALLFALLATLVRLLYAS